MDSNGIILEEQSGFRKHHSCETALNLLLLKWKQSIERGKIVMAVFVDLNRAFETIDRSKLRDVLKRYGIQGIALKWFSSYLENRTQVTRYNKSVSSETAVDLGVPQGSVLGPLLFILYINDLKRVLHRVEVNLFADDTVLFFEGSSYTECFQVMNEELRYFSEWLKWKKLKLNIAKTKYMIVTTRSQTGCTGEVRIDEEVVERVKSMKYLGVMLDEKLNFCEHINYSIKKAAQKFGVLCRVSRYLPFDAKVTLYKTIIAPHFDYSIVLCFYPVSGFKNTIKTNANSTKQGNAANSAMRTADSTGNYVELSSMDVNTSTDRIQCVSVHFPSCQWNGTSIFNE